MGLKNAERIRSCDRAVRKKIFPEISGEDREKMFNRIHNSRRVVFLAAAAAALTLGAAGAKADTTIFDNTPSPLPVNVPSLGYQATQTAEFGNEISFAGTDRDITNVQITMSDWAKQSDWAGVGDATGFDHPITLNFYNPGTGTGVGSLIASKTEIVHVPWHDPSNGFSGTAFNVSFDFSGTTLPDTVIYGVAYNTETWGANPIGAPGPYESLNYGVIDTAPSVGTDLDPDNAYWNTSTAGNYTDGGTAGVGIFREDTGWTNETPIIQVNAVPEPASLGLLSVGGLALIRRRRK
jgi:hypothetical protein